MAASSCVRCSPDLKWPQDREKWSAECGPEASSRVWFGAFVRIGAEVHPEMVPPCGRHQRAAILPGTRGFRAESQARRLSSASCCYGPSTSRTPWATGCSHCVVRRCSQDAVRARDRSGEAERMRKRTQDLPQLAVSRGTEAPPTPQLDDVAKLKSWAGGSGLEPINTLFNHKSLSRT